MKILLEHLKRNLEILNKTSELAGLATHSVNIGVGREAIISSFLKQNLPSFIDYHTGELFDSDEKRSGQLDIILHPITSPKLHLNGIINIFPVETVLACIEVKSSLTGGDTGTLLAALETCKMVKELSKVHKKNIYRGMIDLSSVPFLVFAFNSSKPETILDNLNEFSTETAEEGKIEYRHLPDMIVVLSSMDNDVNKPYYIYKTDQWMYASATFDKVEKPIRLTTQYRSKLTTPADFD